MFSVVITLDSRIIKIFNFIFILFCISQILYNGHFFFLIIQAISTAARHLMSSIRWRGLVEKVIIQRKAFFSREGVVFLALH